MKGVIVEGVHVLLARTNVMVVEAVKLPETPVTVISYDPGAAELLAVKVSRLEELVGFVPKETVRPAGSPVTDRLTWPEKPPCATSVTEAVVLLP